MAYCRTTYVPVAALRHIPMYYSKRLAEPLPHALDAQRPASAVVKSIHHVIHFSLVAVSAARTHCSRSTWWNSPLSQRAKARP